MKYQRFIIGYIQTNCYVIWSGDEAAIIDPGGYLSEIIDFIEKKQLQLKYVLNTHGHADHIAGNQELKNKYDVQIIVHEKDLEMLGSPVKNLSIIGKLSIKSPAPDRLAKPGEPIFIGNEQLEVLEVPGHTPGGVAYRVDNLVFCGDTILKDRISRTDLPGSCQNTLINAIQTQLLTLPPATVLLPGHGEITTVSEASSNNPYFSGKEKILSITDLGELDSKKPNMR